MSLPSVWYPVHLKSKNINVRGFSLAGIPAVVTGYNDHVAWGVTNLQADVLDYYSLTIAEKKRKIYYAYKDTALTLSSRICSVKVRDRDPVELVLYSSVFGPVVDMQKTRAVAMKWTGSLGTRENLCFHKLNRAVNYSEFAEGLKHFGSPPQNFTFADDKGRIAQFVVGAIPKRINGDGRGIFPGDGYNNVWDGFIQFDSMPQVFNPSCGYVYSANQQADTSNRIPSLFWMPPSRPRRINEVLEKNRDVTVESFMKLQSDLICVPAREIVPFIIRACENDTAVSSKILVPILKDWDFNIRRDQAAPLIWNIFLYKYRKLVWDDDLPEHTSEELPRIYPNDAVLEYLTREKPASYWFAYSDEGEDRNEVIRDALEETHEFLQRSLGPDASRWTWGAMHKTVIQHASMIPALSHGPFDLDGDWNTVCASHSSITYDGQISGTYGVSQRLIVELGSKPKAWITMPGGVSGNPASPYYTNFIESWKKGKYFPFEDVALN
jgi:penicillin amidase